MSLSQISIGTHALLNNFLEANAPVHLGKRGPDLIALAAEAGSNIVRVPVDLSVVGPDGMANWALDDIGEWLAAAAATGIKVIFEPGQTPPDLSSDGTPQGHPGNYDDLTELANRFAVLVEETYQQFPQFVEMIEGWEVGNEPNMTYQYVDGYVEADLANQRYYSVSVENGEWYAEYLHATNQAIKALDVDVDISVIAGGIAHNDVAFAQAMFARLQALGAEIDAFSLHPYTSYDYSYATPESGRPTDWVGNPVGDAQAWDHYYSFQGAMYEFQHLMAEYGFADANLWITEFGVASHLGYRNAGEDGEIDQARWYAEAFGVIDAWDNPNLKGVVAHHILDNQSYEHNLQFDAYDNDLGNNGTINDAEDAFGLFHEVEGEITAKPAALLFNAISSGEDFQSHNIHSVHSRSTIDLSSQTEISTGLTSGHIVLSHDGDDTIVGSAFDDSLFAGNGDDAVDGGAGDDRIYGGSGNDRLNGGTGNDHIYGNQGDDVIDAGTGNNRVDGGMGSDRLLLSGAQSDYLVAGDGRHVTVSGNGQSIEGINLETLLFADGTEIELSNIDITRGNGGSGSVADAIDTVATNDTGIEIIAGQTITVDVLANDQGGERDAMVITQINGVDFYANGWTDYIYGVGLVQRNADNTLTIHSLDSPAGQFEFQYTVSDGAHTTVATVGGTIAPYTGGVAANDAGIVIEAGDTVRVDVLANDQGGDRDATVITQINGVDFYANGWTDYIYGVGLVQRNADNTLTVHSLDSPVGQFEFDYTLANGAHTSVASVSGDIGVSDFAEELQEDNLAELIQRSTEIASPWIADEFGI